MTIPRHAALRRLDDLAGWTLDGDAITRLFAFADFPQAVSFVVRLGFVAEAADHHPDIRIQYKRVTLTYTTHSEGGLTDKDFAGAEAATILASMFGGGLDQPIGKTASSPSAGLAIT